MVEGHTPPKPDKESWLREAEEAFKRFLGNDEEWKKPRTFDELEREAVEAGDRLTTRLLQEGLARQTAEALTGGDAPCPVCSRACQPKDEEPAERDLATTRGDVSVARLRYYCKGCRRVFFSSRPRTEPEG